MKFLVLPTRDMSEQLLGHMQLWIDENVSEPARSSIRFDEDKALKLMAALIEDAVNNRMNWIKRPQDLSRSFCETLFGDFFNERSYGTLYEEVLDRYAQMIDRDLDGFIPPRTWRIFYLKIVGVDTVIERGGDYRIMDWQRRLEAGELSLET